MGIQSESVPHAGRAFSFRVENPRLRRAPDPGPLALGVAPTTKTTMQRIMQTGANAVRTAVLNRAALPVSQVRDSRLARAAKRDIRAEAVGFSLARAKSGHRQGEGPSPVPETERDSRDARPALGLARPNAPRRPSAFREPAVPRAVPRAADRSRTPPRVVGARRRPRRRTTVVPRELSR